MARVNVLVKAIPEADRQHPTHLGHILQELGIAYVAAHSPQAKGRIERLWATLQDRLVTGPRTRRLLCAGLSPGFSIPSHGRAGAL